MIYEVLPASPPLPMNIDWTRELGSLNDQQDRGQFLMEHGFTHETIYTTLLGTGVTINHYPLFEMEEEETWLVSHMQEHVSIANAINVGIGFDLTNVDLHDNETTGVWMQLHAALHSQIDQSLGL